MATKLSPKTELKHAKAELTRLREQISLAHDAWRRIAENRAELADALKKFTFPNQMDRFLGYQGNMTQCMINDLDVQRARTLITNLEGK